MYRNTDWLLTLKFLDHQENWRPTQPCYGCGFSKPPLQPTTFEVLPEHQGVLAVPISGHHLRWHLRFGWQVSGEIPWWWRCGNEKEEASPDVAMGKKIILILLKSNLETHRKLSLSCRSEKFQPRLCCIAQQFASRCWALRKWWKHRLHLIKKNCVIIFSNINFNSSKMRNSLKSSCEHFFVVFLKYSSLQCACATVPRTLLIKISSANVKTPLPAEMLRGSLATLFAFSANPTKPLCEQFLFLAKFNAQTMLDNKYFWRTMLRSSLRSGAPHPSPRYPNFHRKWKRKYLRSLHHTHFHVSWLRNSLVLLTGC